MAPAASADPPAPSDSGAPPDAARLRDFAELVGDTGPVCVVGGRTHWDVGGLPATGTREVRAPAGVVSHQPEEMIVRAGAGTTMAELSSVVASAGQMVTFSAADPALATVGGVLASGRGGYGRLRYGPLRDGLLEARYVNADGAVVKAGGPLVKNVTGFDLCRLLVGSLGTLGLLGEVVLRCVPIPEQTQWWRCPTEADPAAVLAALYRPLGVLWDGKATWVGLTGFAADVASQAAVLSTLGIWEEVASPPSPPSGGRRVSLDPGGLGSWAARMPPGEWLAEVGVGTVHLVADSQAAAGVHPPRIDRGGTVPADPAVLALNRAVKEQFDPTGRLNPGRDAMAR